MRSLDIALQEARSLPVVDPAEVPELTQETLSRPPAFHGWRSQHPHTRRKPVLPPTAADPVPAEQPRTHP